MANTEKRTDFLATLLRVLVSLIIAAMVIVFAGFVLMHAHRLGWKLGGIYVGFVGCILSTPLMLASACAFVPALISVILLLICAALEDRMLHAELTGYTEHAARVRFRMIPGVW